MKALERRWYNSISAKKGSKINEKTQRLRYVRALEKFVRSNIGVLKEEPFSFESLFQRVEKNYTILKEIPAVRLDASYPIALENYANMLLQATHNKNLDDDTIEEIKENLLKEANLLHKEKMGLKYKKDKHKKRSFDDGY